MGNQHAKDPSLSLEHLEKHCLHSLQNASHSNPQHAVEFYINDEVRLRKLPQFEASLHSSTNPNDTPDDDTHSEPPPPEQLNHQNDDQQAPCHNSTMEAPTTTAAASNPIDSTHEEEHQDPLQDSQNVYTVQHISSHPEREDILMLKLSNRDEPVSSDRVSLLPTMENHLRHQYNWLAFLYMDLCNALSSSPNSSQQQQTSGDIVSPHEHLIRILRTNAAHGTPIKRLDFSNSDLTDTDALPILFIVKRLKHLVRLDLSYNALSHVFCSNLLQCLSGGSHQDRNTASSSASDKPPVYFLSELDLSYNHNIGDRGAKFLAQGLSSPHCSLHYLNLEQTRITSKGSSLILESLRDNPHSVLVKLNLRQCAVTDDQIHLAREVAMKQTCFCFFEAYPHLDQSLTGDKNQGDTSWLSMRGWNDHSELRDILNSNIEKVRENPLLLQPRTIHSDSTIAEEEAQSKASIVSYLSYINNTFIAGLFAGDPMDQTSLNNNNNNMEASPSIFQEWKQKFRRGESTQQKPSSPVSVKERLSSGDWIVVDPATDSPSCTTPSLTDSLHSAQTVNAPSAKGSGQEDSSSLGHDHSRLSSFDVDMIRLATPTSKERSSSSMSTEPVLQCKICFEDKPASEMYIIDTCLHKFCISCMQSFLKAKIQSFEPDSICCPSCNRKLEEKEVRQILNLRQDASSQSEDLYEKYIEFSFQKTLKKMKGLIYCPNPRCRNAVLFHGPSIAERRKEDDTTGSQESSTTGENPSLHRDTEVPTRNQLERINPDSNTHRNSPQISSKLLKRFYPGMYEHLYSFEEDTLSRGEKPNSSSIGTVTEREMRRFYPSGQTPTNEEITSKDEKKQEQEDINSKPPKNYRSFRVQCKECSTEICGLCKQYYHAGLSCEAHKNLQLRESDERRSLESWMKEKDAKNCPGCGITILKHKGCMHVHCLCGTDFCWQCLKVLEDEELKTHWGLVSGCRKWSLSSIFG